MQSEKLWKKICFVLIFFYRARKIRVDARFLSKFIKAKKINSKKCFCLVKQSLLKKFLEYIVSLYINTEIMHENI